MGTIFETIDKKVGFFYPKTRLTIIVLSLLICTLPLPMLVTNIICGAIVLSIGLMHGATDHYLYMNAKGLSTGNSIPTKFFFKYLSTLLFMGAMWWFSPILALVIFLVVSSYHFGQTQWQYLKLSETSILKKLVYVAWGILVLCTIVMLNPEESDGLINSALPINIETRSYFWVLYVSAGFFFISLLLTVKKQSAITLFFELIELTVIVFFSLRGNLLMAFALFFGFWHSLRASQVQIDKLKEDQEFNWRSFVQGSLPFTLISIGGIAMLLWVSQLLNQSIAPEMLFLIAISVLTMPHMVIYEEFYAKHDKLKTKRLA